ncbi:MAG: 50S ribosomal protein L22 [Gemmataceae bacterium]|jgi:large subunit ribosomal protein L22|nr:50S ribosomal protein L22 [Gemmataceae bacterium]
MSGKKQEDRVLARATYRYAGMSPRKIRLYADLIRGKTADEALQLLSFEITRSARLMEKVLKSAVGNARFKEIEDVEELVVVESRVDGGPVLKRSMPRARGSAYPIMKRLSHIHVGLGF